LGRAAVVCSTRGRVLVYGADGAVRQQWHAEIAARQAGRVVLDDGNVVVCDTHYPGCWCSTARVD
jgi:hypothetical protein